MTPPPKVTGGGADARNDADSAHVNVNAHVVEFNRSTGGSPVECRDDSRNGNPAFSELQRFVFAVTILVVMLALGLIAASCGKSGKSLVSSVNQSSTGGSPVSSQSEPGDKVAMSVAGPLGGEFTFEPLDGDGTPDEKGENAYQLKLEPGDGEGGSGSGGGDFGTRPTIELTITAKKDMGNSWKYALGYIEYDPEKYNPVEFIPGDLFGDDEKDVLNAALFQEKGRIAFWCGLKNFDKKDAKPGGDIGTFVIELVPWEPPRDASTAPDEVVNMVADIGPGYNSGTRYIHFSEMNKCDGDLNGEVGVSDITPLAYYIDKPVSEVPWVEILDYDENDYIEEEDIDEIATYIGNIVDGYKIQIYEDEVMETLIDETTYPDHAGPDSSERARFEHLRDCEKPYGNCSNEYHDVDRSDVLGHTNADDGFYLTEIGGIGYTYNNEEFENYNDVYIVVTPFESGSPVDYGIVSDPQFVHFGDELPIANCTVEWYGKAQGVPPYVPLTITLNASGSYAVADGAELDEYWWDLNNDLIYESVTYEPQSFYIVPSNSPESRRIRLKVKDTYDSWSEEEIVDFSTYDSNMIRFTNWRFNELPPGDSGNSTQMMGYMGSDLMQYIDGIDAFGNPLPIPGIVLQCQLENISNRFSNLNGARFVIDIIESSGTINPDQVFSQVFLVPYDGNLWDYTINLFSLGIDISEWTYSTPNWTQSEYDPQEDHFRIEGYLSPWDKMHLIAQSPDNYHNIMLPPWLYTQTSGHMQFDLSLNYLTDPYFDDFDIDPEFGELRGFELLLLYEQDFLDNVDDIQDDFEGFDIWIIDESDNTQRTFYSDKDGNNETTLKSSDDAFEVRYDELP